MEKRAVLAIVLSLVVVVLWSIFFAPAPPPPPSEVSDSPSEPPASTTAPQQTPPGNAGPVSPPGGAVERLPGSPTAPEAFVTVDTGVARFTLTSQGSSVKAVQLQASFKITEQSLKSLKSENVPNDVLKKLEGIKGQEVWGEKQFLTILKDTIGEEQTVQH